jgi:periplasmic protein TonB
MTAAAERFPRLAARPGEVWLTISLSLLVHALILVTVFLVPRFRIGTYLTVPVTYSVSLESGPSAARRGGAAAAPAPAAPAPAAPAVRAAPAPRAAPPSDELTLPGRRPVKKAPPVEPSLRPTPLVARETPRPRATPDAPPATTVPIVSAPAVALPSAPAPGPAPAGAGSGKGGGLELAGKDGTGGGGTALGYYLSLVDYKINTNWTPVGGGKTNEVVVRFRVLRSGQVRDIELESSSGVASLDAAALRAIRQSVPLPPFPNLLTEPQLDLRYRFVME